MNVGDRIKKLRGSESQEVFGKKIGVSSQYISRIEKGTSLPSIDIALKIAEIYGVTLDWIYTGKEMEKSVEEQEGVYLTKDKYIELLESALGRTKAQNERLKNIAGDN